VNENLTILSWQTIIQTQMHFNDIILGVRSIGISVVMAAYGGAALAFTQHPEKQLPFLRKNRHVSVPVIIFALLLLISTFIMDYFYYYQLLLGAVEKGIEIEKSNPSLVNITLTLSERVSISHASLVVFIFYGIPFFTGIVFLLYAFTVKTPNSSTEQ